MRVWTIVLFILAIHAMTAMINVADITNIGLNMTIDTTSKNAILVSQGGNSTISMPSSNPDYFNQCATGKDISQGNQTLNKQDFVGAMIQTLFAFGTVFVDFMGTFSGVIFGIHEMASPFFGDFNSWVLEGAVDLVLGVSLFQIVSGRSFKTMD